MALNFNRNQAAAQNNQTQNWKADAFINFSVPRKDGTSKKLGAISLKCDRDEETATLVAWLSEDPTRIQKLMEKMVTDFRLAKTDHKGGLDLE
jgi:hypothetical protein